MLLKALARAGLSESAEFWVDHMQRSARLGGRAVPWLPPPRWRHQDFPLDQVAISYSEALLAYVGSDVRKAEAWLEQMLGGGARMDAKRASDRPRRHEARVWSPRPNATPRRSGA